MAKQEKEYKTVWIANNDEAIQKRINWMTQRHWFLIAGEVSSSSPDKMKLRFGRYLA